MTAERPGESSEEATTQIADLLGSPELVQAVENEEYKHFLDHIPIAIAVSKGSGAGQHITYWNHGFEDLVDPPTEREDWAILDRFVHEDDPNLRLGQAVAEGEDFLGVFRSQHEDGATRAFLQAYVARIENEDGVEKYRLLALVDMSGWERSQRDEIERQLRDKDLLLKEIQHRVKNNLQLIVGLIRLEARNAKRGSAVDLDRLALRIEALQMLCQALSGEDWKGEVDLGHYLTQIVSAVVRAHAHEQITLDTQINFSPVSINIAMPVGLAINELLTNAFKHAFRGREAGKITLECLRQDDNYRIVVADDGVGLPAGATWPADGKLGALIVQTLRENAKIELKVESQCGLGTKIELGFVYKTRAGNLN
jgi:two-component sensor histidine kinase